MYVGPQILWHWTYTYICAAERATWGVGRDPDVHVTALINIDFRTADGRLLTPLRPSDLTEVCDQLDGVKVEWENIGLHLDLPYKILEDIGKEPAYRTNQKRLQQMILAWLKGRGEKTPTWQSLIDALEHHAVSENATAEDIRTHVLSKKT